MLFFLHLGGKIMNPLRPLRYYCWSFIIAEKHYRTSLFGVGTPCRQVNIGRVANPEITNVSLDTTNWWEKRSLSALPKSPEVEAKRSREENEKKKSYRFFSYLSLCSSPKASGLEWVWAGMMTFSLVSASNYSHISRGKRHKHTHKGRRKSVRSSICLELSEEEVHQRFTRKKNKACLVFAL